MNSEQLHPGTLAVWAGEESYLLQGATQVPVVHSVSFGYKDVDEWLRVALGEEEGHIYGRNSNPTVHAFEEKVRIMEGAEAATSAATGMGIISSALFTFLSPGDRVEIVAPGSFEQTLALTGTGTVTHRARRRQQHGVDQVHHAVARRRSIDRTGRRVRVPCPGVNHHPSYLLSYAEE